jgi:hypothetical protein
MRLKAEVDYGTALHETKIKWVYKNEYIQTFCIFCIAR